MQKIWQEIDFPVLVVPSLIERARLSEKVSMPQSYLLRLNRPKRLDCRNGVKLNVGWARKGEKKRRNMLLNQMKVQGGRCLMEIT